ncbi:MAG: FRG domain-containing protein [Dongiaceae bacterium]
MTVERTDDPKTGTRIYRCASWDGFITSQRKQEGRFGTGYIFRGHAKVEWRLSSEFERWLYQLKGGDDARNVRKLFSEGAYTKFRERNLEHFKDLVTGFPGTHTSDLRDEDWLALGRHHGLTTGLLDWTRSPYIAAFFAFTEAMELANPGFRKGQTSLFGTSLRFPDWPVAVWALALRQELIVPGEFEMLSSRSEINYWQKAQKGLFTSLTHDVFVDVESYLASRSLGNSLERYEIPGRDAGKALHDFQQMNITYASLFPDFRGAAIQANTGFSWRWLGDRGT